MKNMPWRDFTALVGRRKVHIGCGMAVRVLLPMLPSAA